MSKNIILCSDGTGNKGGHGADTNVYKLYNAVDIHDSSIPQVTFYDSGVGTSKNKYIRGITGAFGFGFRDNVMDLYEFLTRHYEPGDNVFLFGFSRGAATVRAFAGMIQSCGLLDINNECCKTNKHLDEKKFQYQLKMAMEAYELIKMDTSFALEFKKKAVEHGKLKIKFIGVWDTVSALGFPQDWSGAFHGLFKLVDIVTDIPWPHTFYNYQLDENVEDVYHALAIDDERKTFHPEVWNEIMGERPKNIEQVWFAGVHSNVGGGYPRAGLSTVALDWMMVRAARHDVKFKNGAQVKVRADANVHGKVYDSRDGAAIYYRFAPRDIEKLCTNRHGKRKIRGKIKIHRTVIDRIGRGTSRYAPGFLPDEFEIVDTPIGSAPSPVSAPTPVDDWYEYKKKVNKLVATRKFLYRVFVEASLVLLVIAGWFWMVRPTSDFPSEPTKPMAWHLGDVLHYSLPQFFEGFITYITIIHPIYLLVILAFFLALHILRVRLKRSTQRACESACQSLLERLRQTPEGGSS